MKKVLFALSLVACAASVSAATEAKFPVCVDFAAAGYCDAMQYDGKKAATWVRYDCASNGTQTSAKYKKGTTTCTSASGCNPAAAYGWDYLNWQFDMAGSTGTLTGGTGGVDYVLQQDMPVALYAGACSAQSGAKGGVSSLAR